MSGVVEGDADLNLKLSPARLSHLEWVLFDSYVSEVRASAVHISGEWAYGPASYL